MRGWLGSLIGAGLAAACMPWAHADGIYTCVDAKGRRLTSDRPIIECIDREQTEISPSGQVVRRIGPSLTADERAAADEKARRAAEEYNRVLDDRKRDRALLSRYPDKATHDKERNQALASVDEVIKTANKRIGELRGERKKLDTELEFFKSDVSKVPASLKHRIGENEQLLAAQMRFIANQDEEKKRINTRYDQELVRLRLLWTDRSLPTAANRSSSSAAR